MRFSAIDLTTDGVRETSWREWAVRFAFGGLVAVLAGLVGRVFGPVVGGLFLGFPSILPATLTLIKDHQGRQEAAADARGAAVGAIGLIAFALVVAAAAARLPFSLTLLLATATWAVVGVSIWRLLPRRRAARS